MRESFLGRFRGKSGSGGHGGHGGGHGADAGRASAHEPVRIRLEPEPEPVLRADGNPRPGMA
ncbi:MAG TPA: hypothetical protein VM759_03120, partial [Longimicrobium sp.]|nr:hypothetical protein [Longimicrobium sp.]